MYLLFSKIKQNIMKKNWKNTFSKLSFSLYDTYIFRDFSFKNVCMDDLSDLWLFFEWLKTIYEIMQEYTKMSRKGFGSDIIYISFSFHLRMFMDDLKDLLFVTYVHIIKNTQRCLEKGSDDIWSDIIYSSLFI